MFLFITLKASATKLFQSPVFSESCLLIEEEQEVQEVIEDVQGVILASVARQEAVQCLEEVQVRKQSFPECMRYVYFFRI